MSALYLSAAVALLLTVVLGLGHVFRQPGRAESLLAALLFGSTGVALVLVLSEGLGLACALAWAPWPIRNLAVLHAVVPFTTNGGATAWAGTTDGDVTPAYIDSLAQNEEHGRALRALGPVSFIALPLLVLAGLTFALIGVGFALAEHYARGADAVPAGWVARMKRAIGTLTAAFSSDRMVAEYCEKAYLPLLGSD